MNINNWGLLTSLYKEEKYKEVKVILDKAEELDSRIKLKIGDSITMVWEN